MGLFESMLCYAMLHYYLCDVFMGLHRKNVSFVWLEYIIIIIAYDEWTERWTCLQFQEYSEDGIDFADERCQVSARDVVHASGCGPYDNDAVLILVGVVRFSVFPKSELHRNFAVTVEKFA